MTALRPVILPSQAPPGATLLASLVARLQRRDATTLQSQLKLASIPAPTGGEMARAMVVEQALRNAGCKMMESAAGNVVAIRPAEHQPVQQMSHQRPPLQSGVAGQQRNSVVAPIVVMAHLDTVFPETTPLQATHRGTRIHCPGIGDNCRGLAALLAIADVTSVVRQDTSALQLPRPIEFVATVGEEGLGNLRGAQSYFDERTQAGLPDPHAVVVLDGPGASSVVHHGLGSRRYHVTFRGDGGHSWADFGAPNAVHAAARAASWLADLPSTVHARLALTVSRIGGGECVNGIPAGAWMDIDVRATDERLLRQADMELRKLVHAAAAAEPARHKTRAELVVDIALAGERPCGSLPSEHPLVALAFQATRRAGFEPVSAIASTDANVPLARGIPAITIGAGGSGGGAHTTDEWYDNTNGTRGLARALAIVLTACTDSVY